MTITDDVIEIQLSESVVGVLQTKDLKRSSMTQLNDIQVGLTLETIVAKLDATKREIILSVRALEKKEENEALKDIEITNEAISKANKSSIGKLIQEELDEE